MKKQLFIYTILLFIVPLIYLGCSKDDDPVQFSLTVTVTPINSGTVSPSSGIFDDGKEITISATPAEGYDFLKWSGNATGDSNPIQLTVSSDTKIIAEFALQDSDGDGVGDSLDQCPNTPEGELVDATGCASSEVDSDGDGVTDDLDLCADTPANEQVDDDGCADSQKDTDGDGVTDDLDLCADTPAFEEVDEDGCADSQKEDTDGDGVPDDRDLCADTPVNEEVDEDGCADSQKDTDGDGLTDNLDRCPDSPSGTAIDTFGCLVGSTYTYIPDDIFEQMLIDQGYDHVLDDYVLTNSISSITELSLPSIEHLYMDFSINDFTGIEAFTALEQLAIIGGNFTGEALDLSQNSNLKELSIRCSFVDDLDLSQTKIEVLSIRGNFFNLCENRMSGLDLSGVETLKTLNIYNAEFDDLNATLNSATSLEQVQISSPKNSSGPLDYLDLSANNNLTSVDISAMFTIGPSTINLKNGANEQLVELRLDIPFGSGIYIPPPEVLNWEPCIEADDPVYIESIISASETTPQYSVTTDCGN